MRDGMSLADGAHDLRHHARFEVVVQDVSARKPDPARAHLGELGMERLEPLHVVRRIARPALAAVVLVETAVTVRDDVEARHLLFAQVYRERVDVLLAEAR